MRRAPALLLKLLVRLAHQFAAGEDEQLQQPVTVDLGALLSQYSPTGLREMSLSANQGRKEMMAKKVRWQHTDGAAYTTVHEEPEGMVVTLKPMEIKTYFVSTGSATRDSLFADTSASALKARLAAVEAKRAALHKQEMALDREVAAILEL